MIAGTGAAEYDLATPSDSADVLVSVASGADEGYCLTVSADNTNLLLAPCISSPAQRFRYDLSHRLVHTATSTCVTAVAAGTTAGTLVQLATCQASRPEHQVWRWDDFGALRAKHAMYAGICLQASRGSGTAALDGCAPGAGTRWTAGALFSTVTVYMQQPRLSLGMASCGIGLQELARHTCCCCNGCGSARLTAILLDHSYDPGM